MVVADALAQLAQVDGEVADQLVLGVLADGARRSPRASSPRARRRVHGPCARRPASTVRKPDMPGALRSVGNQPEPKLIALSVRLNAARCSSVRALEVGRGRGLGGAACRRTARSPRRRCGRAGPAPRRARRRRGCRSGSGIFPARSAPAGGCGGAAPVETLPSTVAASRERPRLPSDDRPRVDLVGEVDAARRRTGRRRARRAARRRSPRRAPARHPRRRAPRRCRGWPRRGSSTEPRTTSPGSASSAEGAASSNEVQAVATMAGPALQHAAAALDRGAGVGGSVVGEQHRTLAHAARMSVARRLEPLRPAPRALDELVGQLRLAADRHRAEGAAMVDPDHRCALGRHRPRPSAPGSTARRRRSRSTWTPSGTITSTPPNTVLASISISGPGSTASRRSSFTLPKHRRVAALPRDRASAPRA